MNQELTSSTEVPHVSHSAWRVGSEDRVMKDISGLNFRGWSEKLNRFGSLLKTYLESYDLPLTTFVRTWSVLTTASGYGIMKLHLSERYTGDHECSLWRTPDANCTRGACNRETAERRKIQGLPLTLNTQVAHPTLFPTMTANEAKNNNNSPSRSRRHSLTLDVIAGGSLNPQWIEALMGFPQGWTEIEN